MNDASSGRLERTLVAVLKAGSLGSTALLAGGLVLQLAGLAPSLSAPLTGAGLLVLLATPVARVVVSVVEFGTQRDWLFFALTASVLVIFLASLAVGAR